MSVFDLVTGGSDNPYSYASRLGVGLIILGAWLAWYSATEISKATTAFDNQRVLADDASKAWTDERAKLMRESLPKLTPEQIEAIERVHRVTGVDKQNSMLTLQIVQSINDGSLANEPSSPKLAELFKTADEAIRVANEKHTELQSSRNINGWVRLAAVVSFTVGALLTFVLPFWFIDHHRKKKEAG